MKFRHYILFGMSLLLGLAALTVLAFNRPHQFSGSYFEPPVQAPDFSLSGSNGEIFHLKDHLGKVVLIFFGYTNCPDVCPVTLSDFKAIKSSLEDRAEKVRFVFITIDPERDTPERVQNYLANFDPGLIGLTGSREELEPVWKSYGVYQAKADSGSAAGYLVDHSSQVYAIDPRGNLRLTYLFGTDRQAILEDVLYLLTNQG